MDVRSAAGVALLAAALTLAGSPPAPLTLVLSGEQDGYLEPCGCAKPPVGGLARRGGLLSTRPAELEVRLDGGDWTQALGRQDELKAATTARALARMGYAAVNLGERDWALSRPVLERLVTEDTPPLLSGNVRVAADQSYPFGRYVMLERQVGERSIRVAVIGLLSEALFEDVLAVNPELEVTPAAAALKELGERVESADFKVLLFHGQVAAAEKLAQGFAWLDVIVVSHDIEVPWTEARRVGATALLYAGQHGKSLLLAELPTAGPGPIGLEVATLESSIPESASIRQLLTAYLERVGEEELLADQPKRPHPSGQSFVGSQACSPCHPSEFKTWSETAHARAWATLVGNRHDVDPDCVPCHVVGFGFEEGFLSEAATAGLVNVGCENCHGPRSQHVTTLRRGSSTADSSTCLQCHVPDHSPSFDFDSYWPQIAHGSRKP